MKSSCRHSMTLTSWHMTHRVIVCDVIIWRRINVDPISINCRCSVVYNQRQKWCRAISRVSCLLVNGVPPASSGPIKAIISVEHVRARCRRRRVAFGRILLLLRDVRRPAYACKADTWELYGSQTSSSTSSWRQKLTQTETENRKWTETVNEKATKQHTLSTSLC